MYVCVNVHIIESNGTFLECNKPPPIPVIHLCKILTKIQKNERIIYWLLLNAAAAKTLLRQTFFVLQRNKCSLSNIMAVIQLKGQIKSQTLHSSHVHMFPANLKRRNSLCRQPLHSLSSALMLEHNKVSRWLAFPKLASFISLPGAGKCQSRALRLDQEGSS